MAKTFYQITAEDGSLHGRPLDNLAAAVLEAAQHDGYGAVYQRDEAGAMRLYSSARHIGNNPYFPEEHDHFYESSTLADDDAAIIELAAALYRRGILHSRHILRISELTYTENNQLTHVDGETLEDIAAACDSTADDVRRHWDRV